MPSISKIVYYAIIVLGIIGVLMVANYNYDFILYVCYAIGIIGSILMFLSSIYSSMLKPGSLKKSLLGVVVLGVIVVMSYLFSSDEILPMYGNISSSESRLVDVQLITLYILMILSVLSIVYSAIVKTIK